MVNIIEKKLDIEDEAKKKFDIIGKFIGCKPKIINGSIRSIDKTNINYIESFIKELHSCSLILQTKSI